MNKRRITAVVLTIAVLCAASTYSLAEQIKDPASLLPVKVLLLPKFEVGEIEGDFPGEAQLYYEHYLTGASEYDIPNGAGHSKLYYKDGLALCVLGMGKVNAALGTMAILSDGRFDYSQAYIISTGCAGSAAGSTVMGDVFLITSAMDYDLGHHADAREIADPDGPTWFHDADFDDSAVILLDQDLTGKVYDLIKDTPIKTTERTRNYMRHAFDGAEWAVRDPQVLRGTTATGDNYWKGTHGHENALLMADTYQVPDPYMTTEMEDIAVARFVIDQVAGRIPVIGGAGSNSTAESLNKSLGLVKCGIDGLLLITPYYNKANEEGIYHHFADVMDKVDVPCILYNIPGRTGCSISERNLARLREHPNAWAIKEASGSIAYATTVAQYLGDDFRMFSGNDDMVVPIMSLGGSGVISVWANIAPKTVHDMCAKWLAGDTASALKIQLENLELIHSLFCEVNPIPVKAALAHMGLIQPVYRQPLWPMAENNEARVVAALQAAGIIE